MTCSKLRVEFELYSVEPTRESSGPKKRDQAKVGSTVHLQGALCVKRESQYEGDICENTGKCEQDFR